MLKKGKKEKGHIHIGQASIKRQSNFNPGQPQTLATGLFNVHVQQIGKLIDVSCGHYDYDEGLSFFVPFPFRLPSFGSSLVNRRNRKGVIALHPLAFTAPPPLSLRTASLINCKTILTRNWRCNNAFSFIRLCFTRSARSML